MKLLIIAYFLGTLLIGVWAHTSQQFRGNAKNIEFPDKCWHEETKHAFGINEEYIPPNDDKRCEKIHCQEEYVLRFESCQSTGHRSECTIPADYTKKYPECCPKVKPNCYNT